MPSRIDTIVISTQHYENATEEQLLESLTEHVITPILKYAKHLPVSMVVILTLIPTACTSILPGVLCRVVLRQTPA